jgi:ferredoxin
MSANTFKQLQERLNFYSIGFPETATGVEIKILKELFTDDDTSLFLSLSHRLEKPESVAQAAGLVTQPATTQNPGGMCNCCGLCVTTCPSGALILALKTGDQFRIPPVTGAEQMMAMAKECGLLA